MNLQRTSNLFNYIKKIRKVELKVKVERNPDEDLKLGSLTFTHPIHGNIHSFTNENDNVFAYLDVLLPHYNFITRNCNFYKEKENNEMKMTSVPDDYYTDTVDLKLNLDDYIN